MHNTRQTARRRAEQNKRTNTSHSNSNQTHPNDRFTEQSNAMTLESHSDAENSEFSDLNEANQDRYSYNTRYPPIVRDPHILNRTLPNPLLTNRSNTVLSGATPQNAKARKVLVELQVISKKVQELIPVVQASLNMPNGIPLKERLKDVRNFKNSLDFRYKKYKDVYKSLEGMAEMSEEADKLFQLIQVENEERLNEAEELIFKAENYILEMETELREEAEKKTREIEISL